MALEIPEVVINRLPVYARALSDLAARGETVVSSQALGEILDVTPAQIRKDLSYFGRFGKQGRGYNVHGLLAKLREILGIDRQWHVCLVGVGRLGQAIAEYGGFLYDSDYYGDELPFWQTVEGKPHLIVPYSLTANDVKLAGWVGTAEEWFTFVKDGFDLLYREGASQPKMMSIGLHSRLIGHPSRTVGLERLLDYMQRHRDVWITRRVEIARHWIKTHPYPGKGLNE